MEIKTALILFFTLLLSCFIAHSNGKKQTEALSNFNKMKLINRDIDKSHFNASQLFDGAHELLQCSHTGLKEEDKIDKLPGQPKVTFNQYGGYVTVDPKAGRALYYYFAEADHHFANTLPLLLWLNGGPGCSSLAYGAMQELGPFRVHSDGKTLYKNNLAWNHAANVLFLESPAGVGFSYSNTTADFATTGDKRTAMDNYAFLLNWLERFPQYKKRDFYIAGESYAGHYVPQLAQTILYRNKKAKNKKNIINLKGIIIGNALINDEHMFKGMYEYLGSHALISDDTSYQIMKFCNFSTNGTIVTKCEEAANEANKVFHEINIFNIYAPLCSNSSLTDKPKRTSAMSFDPCGEYYVYAYMNRPEVQKALHANITNIRYDWQPCSDVINQWKDSPDTVLPLLKELMADGLRVWVFSGDTDGRLPVTSTQLSIKKMKLDINTTWRPWYLFEQVAGYATVYKGNLTFATVRGAGHQVPGYKPAAALSLIKNFLAGKKLPGSSGN